VANKSASWYSVIRYCANNLTGEVVNVGIVLHSIQEKVFTNYLLLDENSPKVKAITSSKTDLEIYKSFKDSLEFYLKKSSENLFGSVGNITIGSPHEEHFLESLYDYYKGKKMFISRPKFSLVGDLEIFFNKLFETYIGKKYLISDSKQISVKRFMRNIFEDKKLLNRKVVHDFEITPIEDLDNVRIHIDFGFKNGVWNYLQAVPAINGISKNTEWFVKTKFMFENVKRDSKVHLMYRDSDLDYNPETSKIIEYLLKVDSRIVTLDLDNKQNINTLCDKIAKDAHDINEVLIS
jgi:hypothetical protein